MQFRSSGWPPLRVDRTCAPVRRTQRGRTASPMLAQPSSRGSEHALLHCDACMLRPHHATRCRLRRMWLWPSLSPCWRPVPCTYADRAGSTRVRRKAADGAPRHRHREVRAAVPECALHRPAVALAPCVLPCAASLALTVPASRRSVMERSLLSPSLPESLGTLRIKSFGSFAARCTRRTLAALPCALSLPSMTRMSLSRASCRAVWWWCVQRRGLYNAS